MKIFPALLVLAAAPVVSAAENVSGETVVLLHGLGRSPLAMKGVERSLRAEGYTVINVGYPSQRHDIAHLATLALGPIFERTNSTSSLASSSSASPVPARVHIVTHSLGGILVRQYVRDHGVPATLGRVVMLAPPNRGSEIPDRLRSWPLYRWWNGPAGIELGADAASVPNLLGAAPDGLEVGVIAGDRTLNPLLSALIPGRDDGKVSVARTHLDGEADHVVVPHSHTWLMWRRSVLGQVSAFLRTGRFNRPQD